MANPILTSLPQYVEEKRDSLIAEAVLGAKSAKLFALETDVKDSKALTLLATDVVFGDGGACGWDDSGTQTLSQRIIKVGHIKVNMSYCERDMLSKWLGSEVRVAAGAESLPFEETFTSEVINSINEAVETAIYKGDTASSSPNLKAFDGLLKILTDEAGTVDVAASTESTTLAKIRKVYNAIPERAFSRGEVAILVGMDTFRALVGDLVDKNLYHYNPGAPEDEIVLPGTVCRVIGVNGLNGTKKAIAASLKNIYFGTDMLNDMETFKLWYSDDNQEFRLAVKFNAGVQVAFPDEVVLGTL
jgi:hypothetical protein